jgi:hypothetical protein
LARVSFLPGRLRPAAVAALNPCTPRAVGLVAGFPFAIAATSPRSCTTFSLCLLTFLPVVGLHSTPVMIDDSSADMCSLTAAARTFLKSSGPTGPDAKPGVARTAQFLASSVLSGTRP